MAGGRRRTGSASRGLEQPARREQGAADRIAVATSGSGADGAVLLSVVMALVATVGVMPLRERRSPR
ncbi:hypothetical protein ABZS93_13970 [Streptomyces sp900116325]|uniref:hypothetical protein n=1 Tax=Streptomyces sp. 900116325 TaxID=3154295 RepID=UPI0033AD25EB